MNYHSEVVGSLLMPAYLVEARKQLEANSIDAASFKAIEDRAVDEAITLQESAGIASPACINISLLVHLCWISFARYMNIDRTISAK